MSEPTDCEGCKHRHWVQAAPTGTSSSGWGCRLSGGHAITRCAGYVAVPIRPKTLAPCPFCGNARVELMSDLRNLVWVNCRQCHACGPAFEGDAGYAQAELIWNKRSAPVTLRAAKDQLLVEMAKVDDEARQDVFHELRQRYCDDCGGARPAAGCTCTKDE